MRKISIQNILSDSNYLNPKILRTSRMPKRDEN